MSKCYVICRKCDYTKDVRADVFGQLVASTSVRDYAYLCGDCYQRNLTNKRPKEEQVEASKAKTVDVSSVDFIYECKVIALQLITELENHNIYLKNRFETLYDALNTVITPKLKELKDKTKQLEVVNKASGSVLIELKEAQDKLKKLKDELKPTSYIGEERIKQIEELVNKTSKGEWRPRFWRNEELTIEGESKVMMKGLTLVDVDENVIAELQTCSDGIDWSKEYEQESVDNFRFMANARSSVLALLGELRIVNTKLKVLSES